MPDPRVPLGPPLDSSEDDLDDAAEISIEDVVQAKQTVRRHGRNTELPRILDAEGGE